MPVANDTKVLAWVVLRAANRTQARGSPIRLVVLRAPEVAHEVGMELTEAQLLRVEEYLHYNGYIEPANIDLTRSVYTITPAGFGWLEEGMPKLSPSKDRVRELAERAGEEAAFESVLRAELEEERRRMEEIERELLLEEVVRQQEELLGGPETASEEPRRAEPHRATGGTREGIEKGDQGQISRRVRRGLNEARSKQLGDEQPWWRRMFGG